MLTSCSDQATAPRLRNSFERVDPLLNEPMMEGHARLWLFQMKWASVWTELLHFVSASVRPLQKELMETFPPGRGAWHWSEQCDCHMVSTVFTRPPLRQTLHIFPMCSVQWGSLLTGSLLAALFHSLGQRSSLRMSLERVSSIRSSSVPGFWQLLFSLIWWNISIRRSGCHPPNTSFAHSSPVLRVLDALHCLTLFTRMVLLYLVRLCLLDYGSVLLLDWTWTCREPLCFCSEQPNF